MWFVKYTTVCIFVHPAVDTGIACIVNDAVNMDVQIMFDSLLSVLLGGYPGAELLHHMVTLGLIF